MLSQQYRNSEHGHSSFSLLYIITIIFKHKWLIIGLFFGIVGIVVLSSLTTPTLYRAASTFMIEKQIDSQKALLFQMNIPTQFEKYDWVQSEIEIIKSYPVAKCVVESLKLHQHFSKIARDTTAAIEQRIDRAIIELQKRTLITAEKNSNVIETSFSDSDARLARDVVSLIVPTYETYRSMLYDESETFDFLEQQMQITDNNLRNLERHQSEYKSRQEMISPEAQRSILLTRLEDFEARLTELQTKRRRKAALLNIVIDQVEQGEGINVIALESDENPARFEHIKALREDLVALELEREIVLQKFTPEYQEAQNLEKQITATRQKIESELKQIVEMEKLGLNALAVEENIIRQSISRTSQEIKELAQKEYEYTQLSRGIDDTRDIYSTLLKQREEARISKAKRQKDMSVRIISPAVVPVFPVNARLSLRIIIAVLLGLFCGIGLAFLVEYMGHSVTFPEEIESATDLLVLGSVSHFDKTVLQLPAAKKSKSNNPKYALSKSSSGPRNNDRYAP